MRELASPVVTATLLGVSGVAHARVVHLKDCAVTIGNFCVFETAGLLLLSVALFVIIGFPGRILGKRLVEKGVLSGRKRLVELGEALYKYSLYLGLIAVFGVAILVSALTGK